MLSEDDFNGKIWFVLRKINNYYCQNKNKSIIKYTICFFPQDLKNLSSEEECNLLRILEKRGIVHILQRKIINCTCIGIYLEMILPKFNYLYQEYFFYYKKRERKINLNHTAVSHKNNTKNHYTSYLIRNELKILDIILKHYLRSGVISTKEYYCVFSINKLLKKITCNNLNDHLNSTNKDRNKEKFHPLYRNREYSFENSKVQNNLDKTIEDNKAERIIQPLPITGKIEVQGLSEGLQALKNKDSIENGHKFPYKIPAGTHWNNVIIKFINDEEVEINVKKLKYTTNYKEMGMLGKGKIPFPSEQWSFLKVLAKCNGEISIRDQEAKDKYKKQKQALTEILRNYFSIDYDPFYPYKSSSEKCGNSYKIKLLLIPPPDNIKTDIEENTDPLGIQEFLGSQMVNR